METQTLPSIAQQLLQILTDLPQPQQQEVLHFAKFLSQQTQRQTQLVASHPVFQQWDERPDETATALKAEFADADVEFSETILQTYLSSLHREELA